MNIDELKKFFELQTWIFARTYAKYAPHEYIVRDKVLGDDSDFAKAVEFIRQNGIRMFYYKTERRYLFLDGYFYWTMGDSIEKANIINRCKPDDYDIVFMQKGTQAKKRADEDWTK